MRLQPARAFLPAAAFPATLRGASAPSRNDAGKLYCAPDFRQHRASKMKTAELRQAFLDYFAERGHRCVASSTLVPHNDPTLLFTNAGMNQFKDALLGREDPGYRRAVSCQRCVRAGGKHNDLDNVGYTARHLTFFEMLGNFSFGDYFKEETITWAWDFVTGVLGLDANRLWVTVHPDDAESRSLWRDQIGIPAERLVDHADNFWAMGETGPCGPCSELFFDHGPTVPGGPPGSADEDGDRYVEIWNLVFPQFDRASDGELSPLPAPGVDTGMGLERMASVLQGVQSNFEIDLFQPLMRAAGALAGLSGKAVQASAPLRVIADHLRSGAFLIADGVLPGNEDRAYVLRRIIRRALLHGHKLKMPTPFFHRLAPLLVEQMGAAFEVLKDQSALIERVLEDEEARFSETLEQGMSMLERTLAGKRQDRISGNVMFKLYDTYGFPPDLTEAIARERGLAVDRAGFESAMAEQRARGRSGARFGFALGQKIHTDTRVDFLGYAGCDGEAGILSLYSPEGDPLASLEAGEAGVVVLERTPFYAESGGQVGDTGVLLGPDGSRFEVSDTQIAGAQHLHIGALQAGRLAAGDRVLAEVDAERRRAIVGNHSATHLLHAALRHTLGAHVQQKGSLVAPDRLRFDFSHPYPVSAEELAQIERGVNDQILANSEVSVRQMPYTEAIDAGALALFGEKYGDQVRVLCMGPDAPRTESAADAPPAWYSVELCGGTHVRRTGDIGLFRIVSESGIAAGIRRIEAVTGPGVLDWLADQDQCLSAAAAELKTSPRELVPRIQALVEENQQLRRDLREATDKLAEAAGGDLASRAVQIDGVSVVAGEVADDADLMHTLDGLKSRFGQHVIALGQVKAGKVGLVVAVSSGLAGRLSAPELIARLGAEVGARGGGRPELARAGGGGSPEALPGALRQVADWVRGGLGEQPEA